MFANPASIAAVPSLSAQQITHKLRPHGLAIAPLDAPFKFDVINVSTRETVREAMDLVSLGKFAVETELSARLRRQLHKGEAIQVQVPQSRVRVWRVKK